MTFLIAGLLLVGGVGASASLRFPEVLLEHPSFAASLVGVGGVVSIIGLLVAGVLLARLARPNAVGVAGGACLALGAALGLVLVPFWANDVGAEPVAWVAFGAVAIAGPVCLAVWTLRSARGVRAILGAGGLIIVAARSVVWVVNAILPAADGYHFVSSILTVLALVGFPVWVWWLVRREWRPGRFVATPVATVGVLAFAAAMVVVPPAPDTDEVPRVPSAGAAVSYQVSLALSEMYALPASAEDLREARSADRYRLENPPGATLESVDAGDFICAPGASRDHAVLYLHSGGFVMPVNNRHRVFAATISRDTRACVLLAHYRHAPEHPFPASLDDTVRAYRWLRERASRVVLLGESCGGNFVLSAAISLRDSGDVPPDAVVSISGGTDLTRSGETHRTKAGADPMLNDDDVDFSVRSYTDNPRDPLVSPLFANLADLPPTLLLAGSQEVLLSDSIRMADRMRAAGSPVRLEVWPGMIHAWPAAVEELPESRLAMQHVARFLSRHLTG